jgi:hypothetical protein
MRSSSFAKNYGLPFSGMGIDEISSQPPGERSAPIDGVRIQRREVRTSTGAAVSIQEVESRSVRGFNNGKRAFR